MRISKVFLISMCCLLAPSAVWGQATSGQAKPGILGYLNPQTHTFHALAQPVVDTVEPPALTTFTGTVTVTITITLKSSGITNVNCVSLVSVQDGTFPSTRSFSEADIVAATGSGSTRTCTVSVPYSGVLPPSPVTPWSRATLFPTIRFCSVRRQAAPAF